MAEQQYNGRPTWTTFVYYFKSPSNIYFQLMYRKILFLSMLTVTIFSQFTQEIAVLVAQ